MSYLLGHPPKIVWIRLGNCSTADIERSLLNSGDYEKGDPALYGRTRALHPHLVLDFVQTTQPSEWRAITAYYAKSAAEAFLAELTLALDARGTLDVLRHGLDFFGQTFHFAYLFNPHIQPLGPPASSSPSFIC